MSRRVYTPEKLHALKNESVRHPRAPAHFRGSASIVFVQIHPGIESGDLVVAVKHLRVDSLSKERTAEAQFSCLAIAGVIHLGIDVSVESIFACVCPFHVVGGWSATKRILTNDFKLLKPYFHGITILTGAPS